MKDGKHVRDKETPGKKIMNAFSSPLEKDSLDSFLWKSVKKKRKRS